MPAVDYVFVIVQIDGSDYVPHVSVFKTREGAVACISELSEDDEDFEYRMKHSYKISRVMVGE